MLGPCIEGAVWSVLWCAAGDASSLVRERNDSEQLLSVDLVARACGVLSRDQ